MFDKSKYDQQYMRANVVRRYISLNKTKKDDARILDRLTQEENYSQYIKDLILRDIDKTT